MRSILQITKIKKGKNYQSINQQTTKQKARNKKFDIMDSENEEFILIDVNDKNGKVQQQVMFDNAQLTHSIINQSNNSNIAGSIHSIDGWSEITAPSVRSINSSQRKVVKESGGSVFGIFGGTFLQNTAGSDKGYYLINPSASQENPEGPIFSSYDVSTHSNEHNHDGDMPQIPSPRNDINNMSNNIERHSIGSVGSRVPFSWAEVTKIQPQFHNDPTAEKPKVFDQTPKIRTRYRAKAKDGSNGSKSNSPKPPVVDDNTRINNEQYPMAAIPESDPYATKADLGRRVRRSGKRGSRLKYPNGRRGTKKNWRKKNQSK